MTNTRVKIIKEDSLSALESSMNKFLEEVDGRGLLSTNLSIIGTSHIVIIYYVDIFDLKEIQTVYIEEQ